MTIRERVIYSKAIDEFGEDNQLSMAQEECGELVAAISHWNRGKIELPELLKEIADVEIMVGQLRLIFEEFNFKEIKDKAVNELLYKISENKGVKFEG